MTPLKKDIEIKQRLKNQETCIGAWITLGHEMVPAILGNAGFDFMTIDLEHTSTAVADLPKLIVTIEAYNSVPLVRVGKNDADLIKRVMDCGAHGVIVPNVMSVEEAKEAVAAVKYPPLGKRGVGLYKAHGFGHSFKEYLEWNQEESLVIIQIEHIDAVDQVDEIFQVPGVDGYMIGPYDLSGSMGIPGQLDDPKVEKACEKVKEVAKKYGISPGYHSVPLNPKLLKEKKEQGYRFLVYSTDAILMGVTAVEHMKNIRG